MSEKRLQKRDEISDEYKWKLEDMYETDELWEAECEKASQLAEKLSGFKGHLADSAATLLDFFKKQDELSYYLERIVVLRMSARIRILLCRNIRHMCQRLRR